MNAIIIEKTTEFVKTFATDLRNANKEYTSISRVLKDIQTPEMLDAGYRKVFDALGLEGGMVIPAGFFNSIPASMHGKDKKGNDFVGIWGYRIIKDAEGKEVGKEPVLRKVTAWSPTRIFKVLAQAKVINSEKK